METIHNGMTKVNIVAAGTRAPTARAPDYATRHRLSALLAAQENVPLEPRTGLSLRNAAGMEIACLSGCVWLTMEGDSRDITLAAGDAFTLERNGLALISAIEPSLVSLRTQWDASYGRWPRWLQTIASWLVRAGEARARRHLLSRYY